MSGAWKVAFGAALVVIVALDFFRDWSWSDPFWELPLFFTGMGLLGAVALTLLAKGVLSRVADRDEDYYEPYGITEVEATGKGAEREGNDVW